MRASDRRRTLRSESPGWVYFIRATRDGMIRIGHTADHPDVRLRRLRATCPGPLEALATIEGPKSLETEIHTRFVAAWDHGEWFAETEELRAFITHRGTPWTARPLAFKRPLPVVKSPASLSVLVAAPVPLFYSASHRLQAMRQLAKYRRAEKARLRKLANLQPAD